MSARFYVPDGESAGQVVDLPPEESGHLMRVLRLKPGDRIRVFNGRGGEFGATVDRCDRRQVRVRIGEALSSAPELATAITFAPAVLKGDKMDDVVRDAVMMGAAAIQPVVSSRSETTLTALERGRRVVRWHRVAISSAKQCGRAVVPGIAAPCSFEAAVAAVAAARLPAPAFLFVEPSCRAATTTGVHELPPRAPAAVTIMVGPEGGWTEAEIQHGAAACRLVTMAGPTIRADAMATVAMAALLGRWGAL